jgi:hypothetical protein
VSQWVNNAYSIKHGTVTLLDIKGTKNKSENIEDYIEYLKKII